MVQFPQIEHGFEVTMRSEAGVAPELAHRAERRLLLSLGRLARHIRSVRVRLSDTNGRGRGGIDKQCVVAVRLAGHDRLLLIEDVDRRFETATDRAADRAGRALAGLAGAFVSAQRGVERR